MQIIDWQQFLNSGLPQQGKPSSMTIGIFDGVHRGHQTLIKKVVSHNAEYIPVIVTFRQNYKTGNNEHITEIHSFEDKLAMFKKLGIQITIVIDFTETFRQMPGIEFLDILLKHGNVGYFAVGNDFRCGNQLDTDVTVIKKFFASFNITCEVIPEVMECGLPVSSSRIRNAITAGDFSTAEKMLGHTLYTKCIRNKN